ncbi:MAG: HypC/HybG/HupF family hydrogenase formation chaperone [Planctomycetaceae bacterium]|nr:HypC/HybG/HupF family hydrogenase formation chaperone [Planctomycetaceae bacterium]
MCLAVPGKLVQWLERRAPFSTAAVEFAGVRRSINMACVPDATEGDYVLVHAGIAISRIDAAEAQRVLSTFAQLGLDQEANETGDPP